jgi:hypothetical protein
MGTPSITSYAGAKRIASLPRSFSISFLYLGLLRYRLFHYHICCTNTLSTCAGGGSTAHLLDSEESADADSRTEFARTEV